MTARPEPDMQQLEAIVARFDTGALFIRASRTGSGHINDSWLVETRPEPGFILQRINHHVFRDIQGLMHNIAIVLDHLGNKIRSGTEGTSGLSLMHLIPSREGSSFIRDDEGNYWRMYNHIAGSRSYDTVGSAQLACEGGKAFGLFQLLTSDLEAGLLNETIPGFHHIGRRLKAFHDTVVKDPAGRADKLHREIAFVARREKEMLGFRKLMDEGSLPVRVTHNDTKINNILFDAGDRAVCIVDLDTVMPGSVLYDFGDAIRTGANKGEEDEKVLEKAGIDLALFEAYSRGYLEVAHRILTDMEMNYLAFSARFMTFIIGLRFLTDHIDGDRYFRIRFEGHNLQRARAQFRLLETMEEHTGEMERIIRDLIDR
jgi:serine/threonine protein kinase